LKIRTTIGTVLLLLWLCNANAEQLMRFGAWEVHYAVLPSTFLRPAITQQYGVVRAEDSSLVNISMLDASGTPARGQVQGSATNLLGQRQPLHFAEVLEPPAVYYLAQLRHANEEVTRFEITVTREDGTEMVVEFQQKLYWEDDHARGSG